MAKSYHHGNLRQSLLDEAANLIQEEGLDGLSLRKIAARAGVSHAAPYRHFRDMAELIAAVAEQGFGLLEATLLEAASKEGDRADALLETGVAYVRFALQHRTHFRVMFREHPHPSAGLEEAGGRSFGVLVGLVAEGVAAGAFRVGPVEDMALAAWTQVHGIASLALDGLLREDSPGGASGEEQPQLLVTRRILPVLFAGLLAKAEAKSPRVG